MSQYKQINGVKYEKELVEYAEASTTLQKHHVSCLFHLALDGGRITPTEKTSLLYIIEHYKCTSEAKNLMQKLLSNYK